ncbi:unnamed protein product [Pleuronectes platessa]|uniref:Uncharacterized protein n=1 Tax=Pleuronectes platessa TaxID=8262 RepID=A0A9N7UQE4_PLEPL|nr:unnamed protein product [Pleuronectes platessa]
MKLRPMSTQAHACWRICYLVSLLCVPRHCGVAILHRRMPAGEYATYADFIQQRRQDESPSGSRRASSASEGQHPAVREKLVEQRCPGKNPSAKLPSVTLPPAFVRPRGAAFSQEVVEINSWLRPDELNASGAQLLQDVVRAERPAGVVAQTLDVRFTRSES